MTHTPGAPEVELKLRAILEHLSDTGPQAPHPQEWKAVAIPQALDRILAVLKAEQADLLEALEDVENHDGGMNIMGDELCSICSNPAPEHSEECPMPAVGAAIAKARP